MTLLTLIQKVSNVITEGVTLSTTTFPTKAQVTDWLNDGQRQLAIFSSPDKLPGLIENDEIVLSYLSGTFVLDYAQFDLSTLTGYLKPLALNVDGVSAGFVDYSNFHSAINTEFWGTANSPLYTVAENKLFVLPKEAADANFFWVKEPTDMSGDSDTPSVSALHYEALVSFAVAMYYQQQENPQLFMQAWKLFSTQI
jgi:hypothetical protein